MTLSKRRLLRAGGDGPSTSRKQTPNSQPREHAHHQARVQVQLEVADLDQREVSLRSDFGQVAWIERKGFRLRIRHDLDERGPTRKITTLDAFIQVTLVGLAILADQDLSLGIRQILDPLLGAEVELYPCPLVCRIEEAVGVAAKAVHVPERDILQECRAPRTRGLNVEVIADWRSGCMGQLFNERGAGTPRHRTLSVRWNDPVVVYEQVPARLCVPGRRGDFARLGVHAPWQLGVRKEESASGVHVTSEGRSKLRLVQHLHRPPVRRGL